MMQPLLSRIFPLSRYPDSIQRFRAYGTYFTSSFILVGAIVALIFAGIVPVGATPNPFMPLLVAGSLLMFAGSAAAILLTRVGQRVAGSLTVIILWFIMAFIVAGTNGYLDRATSIMLVGIAFAALLIGGPMVIVTTVGACLIAIEVSLVDPQLATNGAFTVSLPLVIEFCLFGAITYALANGVPNAVRDDASDLQDQRLSRAEANVVINQQLLEARFDLDSLLKKTISLVRDRVADADNVQLFLADSQRRNVTLAASTFVGESAEIGYEIGIGSLSAIGRVAITGQLILVRATTEERPYRRLAFLPDMHSELALPLQVSDTLIGVLDIQSANGLAFKPEENKELEALANQIAVALQSARLYADSQAQAAENLRLYEQARRTLLEAERLNRQLTGGAWTEFLQAQSNNPAFTVDLTTGHVENAAEWTPTLVEASRLNQITIQQTAQAKIVALPISIRDQPIGAMEFEIAPDQEISAEQMAVLQQVVERLGLAAENARLFDEAQRVGQREALVNEISARMQATTNVEGVLAAATQSLADAFQAPRVAIRLGTPDRSHNT